jgi:hypothetical protein
MSEPLAAQTSEGSGSGILRVCRKVPLLFGEESLKTVCFDSFILKQALKQTRSVCLRAFQPAISALMRMACEICGLETVLAALL